MEAKDTVLSKEQLDAIDLKNAESNFIDALYDTARQQAEISFKAGIKEVVDWVNKNVAWRPDAPYKSAIDMDDWKAKVKEWGIE